tara:strand:+ start:309 stop:632 length:324 start_codon:yes stop_codon:yes gene_type:complete
MVIPIYSKTLNIVRQKTNQKIMNNIEQVAETISLDDQLEIEKITNQITNDARGNIQYNRTQALNLLPFFQKYFDKNVTTSIFGCGGCAKKLVRTMKQLTTHLNGKTK